MPQQTDTPELVLSWRDYLLAAALFVFTLLFFWGMSTLVGWPNPAAGWQLVVIVAAIAGAIPLLSNVLNFLRRSSASIEAPFGLKLNFSTAIQASESRIDWVLTGTVQQGVVIPESGQGELERSAVEASSLRELVIDLENGQAWYLTRLFAVAAMAGPLGSPEYLIFIGQRGATAKQPLGYVRSADLVRAICAQDGRYRRILAHALQYLASFSDPAYSLAGPYPFGLDRYSLYKPVFDQVGDAAFMRVLVDQLIQPDPQVLAPGETPPELGPPWIASHEMEQRFSSFLITDNVELTKPPKEQVAAILGARGHLALAVRNGVFEGIIQVEIVARHLLLQLAERASD